MDINEWIDKLYSFLPEKAVEPVQAVVEVGGGAMPFVSSALNYLKFRKINKELSSLKEQLTTITEKANASQNELFIKQEVFPIILNRIVNDEQSEKIKIILNGFEYIIDNEILNLDKIFHFYDVLAEMRLNEIVHFTEKYVEPMMKFEQDPNNLRLNLSLKLEYSEEDFENEDLERYMNNKLFRLGILEYVKDRIVEPPSPYSLQSSMPFKWQPPEPDRYETNTDKYQISNFGKRFVKFFYEEDTKE